MAAGALEDTLEQAKFLARFFGEDDPESAAVAILTDLKLPGNESGYHYLKRSILRFYDDPYNALASGVYQHLGEELAFHPNGDQIGQAMQRAIRSAWAEGDERLWRIYFCIGRDRPFKRPSNLEFIAGIAQFLELWRGCCRRMEREGCK